MWKKQIILILCILWIGGSLAKSFYPTTFDYNYKEDSRKSTNNYRGKSASTTPRPTFQQYWQSFVRNIPTLPPFSWNMANSLSNIFNTGAQQIMGTPVEVHQTMHKEPNRRRKAFKRKSSAKKNKNRRVHSSYYDYNPNSGYQQTQLQALGVDEENFMHFYDAKTGQYYTMQMVSAPSNHYNHQSNNYYNKQAENAYQESNDNSDAYYQESYVDKSYGEQEEEHGYDNEYNTKHRDYDDSAEPEGDGREDYADDVVVADKWGYTDDEVFGDRKLKGSLEPIETLMEEEEVNKNDITGNTKHLLKPETEEDLMILLTKAQKNNVKRLKPTPNKEATVENEEETVRNILGTFVKEDGINRRRKSGNTKLSTRLVEKPRQKERYYIFPANFWLK